MVSVNRLIILLTGPSGVGKSTVIEHLLGIDSRLRRMTVYTTRQKRDNDDKNHISLIHLMVLQQAGQVKIFRHYGSVYGEPIMEVLKTQQAGKVPIMDISVEFVDEWLRYVGGKSFVVYLFPESIPELKRRLQATGRDITGNRLEYTRQELKAVRSGKYNSSINRFVTNRSSISTARSLLPELRKVIDGSLK